MIVATPPPTGARHRLVPRAPVRRGHLLRSLDMGQLMKCDAIYETPFWRAAGLTGFGISDHGAARAVFDNTPPAGGPGVLLAFVGGSAWRTYGPLSKDQRRAAVLEGFAAMFGPQALSPVDYVEHDWTKERWSGGGPTAIHGPARWSSSARPSDAARPGALGRHGDLDVLVGLHGRRGALGRAGRRRGACEAPALKSVSIGWPRVSAVRARRQGADGARLGRGAGAGRRPDRRGWASSCATRSRPGGGYLPAGDNVFRAFRRPLADVRVLVVGQDPYPTPGAPDRAQLRGRAARVAAARGASSTSTPSCAPTSASCLRGTAT